MQRGLSYRNEKKGFEKATYVKESSFNIDETVDCAALDGRRI